MPTPSALIRSSHPGPAVSVTAVAVVLGAAIGLEPLRLLLLGLVVLANQASVGLSNDWLDAGRDRAVGRTDKPVATGEISLPAVRAWAIGSAAVSVSLSIVLGPAATLANVVFIVSAWGYNLGLKGTAVSVVPYLVSFGLLPTMVTLTLPEEAVATWWATGMGALLGAAAHFANALPDFDEDRRTGIRGLPLRLGKLGSGVTICLTLVAASVLAVVGPVGTPGVGQWAGLVITTGIAIICGVLLITRSPSRLLFQLIIVAALVNVALLALSGDRLIA